MNILIIGSKGFIGMHTLRYFTEQSHSVYGCDVVVDYTSENYILLDATNADFQEVFKSRQFDVCINCSGAASVPDSLIHPHRDFELNVNNVFKMLDAIRKHQPNCKFINLSSAAVYGNPSSLPVAENAPLRPVSPYGIHKQMAETILLEFHIHYNIPTLSLRLFSVYGPCLQKQLFWDLYKKMKTNSDEIIVLGTGNESRDFIYIQDLTRAIDITLQKATFDGKAYNCSNGVEILVRDAVEQFASALKWKGKITYTHHTRTGDPKNWQAEISWLKGMQYHPAIDMMEGLKNYVQWLKDENK